MRTKEDLLSESMEMYLVTIARLREDGNRPVPLSQLAEALSVTSVSVNEMCRKLHDSGYLIYRPYKGAVLTEKGEKFANYVLRRHRLWEVFLIEKLHLDHKQANEAACALEHVIKDEVIDHLDEFLGFPTVDPRGLPIPKSNGNLQKQKTIPLSEVSAGSSGHILQCDVTEEIHKFLGQYEILEGKIIKVIAAGRNDIFVATHHGQLALSKDIAEKIMIVLSKDDERNIRGNREITNEVLGNENSEEYLQMNNNKEDTIEQIPLSDLKKGQQGIIVHVGGKGAVKGRMMDMGIVPGSEISLVRVAPFGDPLEFSIKGYSLSLRKSEAEKITVEKVG